MIEMIFWLMKTYTNGVSNSFAASGQGRINDIVDFSVGCLCIYVCFLNQ